MQESSWGTARTRPDSTTGQFGSKIISRFTKDKFLRKFRFEGMKPHRFIAVRSAGDVEYLWTHFQKLKTFYLQATNSTTPDQLF